MKVGLRLVDGKRDILVFYRVSEVVTQRKGYAKFIE